MKIGVSSCKKSIGPTDKVACLECVETIETLVGGDKVFAAWSPQSGSVAVALPMITKRGTTDCDEISVQTRDHEDIRQGNGREDEPATMCRWESLAIADDDLQGYGEWFDIVEKERVIDHVMRRPGIHDVDGIFLPLGWRRTCCPCPEGVSVPLFPRHLCLELQDLPGDISRTAPLALATLLPQPFCPSVTVLGRVTVHLVFLAVEGGIVLSGEGAERG
jgi:hypothetical protein